MIPLAAQDAEVVHEGAAGRPEVGQAPGFVLDGAGAARGDVGEAAPTQLAAVDFFGLVVAEGPVAGGAGVPIKFHEARGVVLIPGLGARRDGVAGSGVDIRCEFGREVGDIHIVGVVAFDADQVEKLVLHDGATDRGAELALGEGGLLPAGEGALGVPLAGAVEEEGVPGEIVAAALGDDVQGAARGPAVLRREAVGHHHEFLDGVLAEGGAGGTHGDVVVIETVHHDVVGPGVLTKEGKARARSRAALAGGAVVLGDQRCGEAEAGEVAAVDGEVRDLVGVDGVGHLGAGGVHDAGGADHFHRGAGFHRLHVHIDVLGRGQSHAHAADLLGGEAGRFDGERVGTGREETEGEATVAIH